MNDKKEGRRFCGLFLSKIGDWSVVLVLERVLYVTRCVMRRALHLVDLAFRLQLGVARPIHQPRP